MMKLYLSLAAALILYATACGDSNTTPDPDEICAALACDDGNPCTTNACDADSESCVHSPVANGTECALDGDPGSCTEGVCVIQSCNEADCIDDNPCTVGACNERGTECVFENEPDGTPCSPEEVGLGTCLDAECATGTAELAVTVTPIEAPRVTFFIECPSAGTIAGDFGFDDGVFTRTLLLPVGECSAEFTVREENLDPLCVAAADLVVARDVVTDVQILISCQPLEE